MLAGDQFAVRVYKNTDKKKKPCNMHDFRNVNELISYLHCILWFLIVRINLSESVFICYYQLLFQAFLPEQITTSKISLFKKCPRFK